MLSYAILFVHDAICCLSVISYHHPLFYVIKKMRKAYKSD